MMLNIWSRQACSIFRSFFVTVSVAVITDSTNMDITCASPKTWHLGYSHRLMASSATFDYISRHNPTEISRYSINNSNNVPWESLSGAAVLLSFVCQTGYVNNNFVLDINQGLLARYFEMLKYLKISGCIIDKLTSKSFQGLTRLNTLEISSKYLLHLPLYVFWPLESIIWIKLVDCNIESINSELFCNNPKLTFVSFKSNNIRNIYGMEIRNASCKAGILNSFVLEDNNIGDITNVNFQSYRLNGIMALSSNSIRALSKTPFDGLTDVLTIDLKRNFIRYLPYYAFTSLNKTLKYMNFEHNELRDIDISKTFSGLKLETLILSHNRILTINGKFSDLNLLEGLYLQNNSLNEVVRETFSNMTRLDTLNVSNNNIAFVEKGSFELLASLTRLHMEKNKIKYLPPGIFDDMSALKRLYIYSNEIASLDERTFEKCGQLEWLELQNNKMSNVSRLIFTSRKIRFIKIEYNRLSAVPVITKPESVHTCDSFPNLQQIKARHNTITSFDTTCYENLQNLDLSYNLLEDISNFGVLTKIEKLFLRNNSIRTLPVHALQGLCTNLIMLDIGLNLLEVIDYGVFSNCQKLETLKLDKNLLKTFYPLYQASFRDLRLASNPLKCDCDNKDLISWLNSSSTVNIDGAICDDGVLLLSFHLEDCHIRIYIFDWLELVLKVALPILILLLLAGVIALIIFKYRYEVQVIAFYKWNIRFSCCTKKKSGEPVERKYDAFVCFAEEDILFVKEKLIPVLEPKYKICIHYRDFPVGEDIAETILDVIANSSVVIVVLSENFMKSRWGTFEFRNAHYAAIQKKEKRLLIVILSSATLRMKMDLTLKSILYSKSYLRVDDKLFNEKLLHAMPDLPVQRIYPEEDAMLTGKSGAKNDYTSTINLDEIYHNVTL